MATKRKKKKLWVVSREKDLDHKAKRLGKRTSAKGNVYYESRLNRADVVPKNYLGKGGKIAKTLNKKVTLKQILKGK